MMKGTLQNTEEQPITKHSGLELATNLREVFTIIKKLQLALTFKTQRSKGMGGFVLHSAK